MYPSGKLRTVSRSIRTLSLALPALVFLQACKIDRSAPAEREEARTADPPRSVYGDKPKERTNPANSNALKYDTPRLHSETRRPPDRKNPTRPPREPSNKQPAPTAQSATRSRAGEQVPHTTPPVSDPGKLRAKIDGRVLRYQPPGAHIGDPGEIAQQTRIVQQQTVHPIIALIHRWADTLLSRDLNAHMALYAPILARFGDRTNVNREDVRSDKQTLMATLANVPKFEIYDLRISEGPGAGVVSAVFRAESQTGTGGHSSHSAWYRLTFSRNGGGWQIQSEEQLDH